MAYRNIRSQAVTVSGTSAAVTNAFGSQTYLARIASTTGCFYVLGTAPTAAATDAYLPANEIEYIQVIPGEKIAFIQETSGGTASVTELI